MARLGSNQEGALIAEHCALFSRIGRHRGESRELKAESSSAIFAAEDALCEQAIGETCGI
jgi:hypothetical protein